MKTCKICKSQFKNFKDSVIHTIIHNNENDKFMNIFNCIEQGFDVFATKLAMMEKSQILYTKNNQDQDIPEAILVSEIPNKQKILLMQVVYARLK